MAVILSPEEVRVLGVLVEKELSTPEYYPMTENALLAGCNQKSNREPVVSLTDEEVHEALETLQRQRLAGTASGAYGRVPKYRHSMREALSLDVPALSILAELMLRGPQTTGELRGRTARMHAFESLEAVEQTLEELGSREAPLVVRLERQPGQKEARYAHLLSGEPVVEAVDTTVPAAGGGRIAALEAEVAVLRDRVQQLEEAFTTFREQFE